MIKQRQVVLRRTLLIAAALLKTQVPKATLT